MPAETPVTPQRILEMSWGFGPSPLILVDKP